MIMLAEAVTWPEAFMWVGVAFAIAWGVGMLVKYF